MTGVSLLRELAARDIDALLLERRHLAAGASGRNAGFLLEGTAANYAAAVRQHGRAVAREVWAFTAENHARLAEALAGAAGHRRLGAYTLAASAEEELELEAAASLMQEDGFPAEYRAGRLLNPRDGELDPAAAVDALAQGGQVIEGCEVTSLGAGGVETSRGDLQAATVVLATNAYTPQLLAAAPIRPVRAQMLATAPAGELLVDRPTYSDWGYRYWRQLADGRLLLGGFRNLAPEEEVGYVEEPSDRIQNHLERHLQAMGVEAPVTHRWAGIMGFTPDSLPLVGPVPGRPGLFVCGGYTGHGLGFAFNAARRLVGLLLDGQEPPSWMAAARLAWRTPG